MASDTNSCRPVLVSLTDTDIECLRMLYAILLSVEDDIVADLRVGLLDVVNRCDLAIYRQLGEKH